MAHKTKYKPAEIGAVRTEGRLSEEFGDELVTSDLVDLLMFDSASPADSCVAFVGRFWKHETEKDWHMYFDW